MVKISRFFGFFIKPGNSLEIEAFFTVNGTRNVISLNNCSRRANDQDAEMVRIFVQGASLRRMRQ
jgi:hypothetical protein